MLTGCAKRETPVQAGIRTQTLHVGNGVEIQGLDPHTTTGANDFVVQSALFESLILPDPVTGQPTVPGVARTWEVSSDLLTYTFHARLREAARAPDSVARSAVYRKMEAILAREMPVIPLHFEVLTYLLHPAVRGWHANGPNSHPWKFVSLEATP